MGTGAAIDTITKGGTAGLLLALVIVVIGAIKQWWVPGITYRECQAKLARYEDMAYKALVVAERSANRDADREQPR